jgi:hypothetical protein
VEDVGYQSTADQFNSSGAFQEVLGNDPPFQIGGN